MTMLELQQRLTADAQLSKIRVIGVDPGTMVTGMTRGAPWAIRVLMFQIVIPLALILAPNNGTIRPPSISASHILRAAALDLTPLQQDPAYLNGTEPLETSPESQDPTKRALVWTESAKLAGLQGNETVLANWQ